MNSGRTPEAYNRARAGRVTEHFIHCSGTPNGQPVSVAEIDAWHRARGFSPRAMDYRRKQNPELSHIGYHHIVYPSGACATGRHLDEMGQHVRGRNLHSIGTCLIGTDRFTRAQWIMLRAIVWAMDRRYLGLKHLGHRDASPDLDGDGTVEPHEWIKTCPGFSVADWIAGRMEPLAGHIFEQVAARA
ncbi:MAG: N-acetylmuramoyl-L-alanine amidase [Pseudomonadota bacterium]